MGTDKKKEEKTEKRSQIRISVRNLVEFILREGDIDNRHGQSVSPEAMLAGSRMHRKIQKRKGSDYHAEVPLKLVLEEEYYDLILEGRADGIQILTEGEKVVRKLEECILQPQSEIEKVRAFLLEKGYEFLEEDMVCEDGKYYPMMKVRPPVADTAGEDTEVKCWDTVQLKYGKLLLEKQHPVLREYLEREIRIYQSILEGLKAKDSDRIRQRKEELEQELVEAEKGMKYYAV